MGPVGTLGAQPDPWAGEEVVTRATLRTQRQDSPIQQVSLERQQHSKKELGHVWERPDSFHDGRVLDLKSDLQVFWFPHVTLRWQSPIVPS